jgi:hypothetical protein
MNRFAKFILLIVISVITTATSVQAGFLIKKNHTIAEKINPISGGEAINNFSDFNDRINRNLPNFLDRNNNRSKSKPSYSGWEGIAAICCAFFVPPLGIIFGAMGMGQGHKNRGLAIAGFVIGCVYTLVMALIIVMLLAFWL